MPRLEYFLVSGGAAIDQITGRISAFDILIEIRPVRLPVVFARVVTICSFSFEEDEMNSECQLVTRITPPGGQAAENRTNFTIRDRHHNIVLNWVGVRINQAGSVDFELRLNENVVAHHDITVHAPQAGRIDGILIYPQA